VKSLLELSDKKVYAVLKGAAAFLVECESGHSWRDKWTALSGPLSE